uniref:Prolactin n=1 Tax=Mus spicilegus TaxID=10103 RepID=A0A8C6G7F0_MUSSI
IEDPEMNPHTYGTLFLMLLANMCLWEEGYSTSVPLKNTISGYCQLTHTNMFDWVGNISENISHISSEASNEFFQQYVPGRLFSFRLPMISHTSFLPVPNTKRKMLQKQPEVLLRLVVRMLGAWKTPLRHLMTEMSAMQEAPEVIISKVRDIDEKLPRLLEGIRTILSQVSPLFNYLPWLGLKSLQVTDEDSHLFAIHSLLNCLHNDAKKVAACIKVLRC